MRVKGFLVFLLGIALATAAMAQTKISGTLQCGKPDPMQKVDVGDQPNHALTLARIQCTWTKPTEMAGVQSKDGVSVESGEMSGDKSSGNGYHTGTMVNGDKIFVRYQGSGAWKEGALQSTQGTWSFTGGTGKLKGLKGKGTSKGKANPDGTMTYEIEGEYQVP